MFHCAREVHRHSADFVVGNSEVRCRCIADKAWSLRQLNFAALPASPCQSQAAPTPYQQNTDSKFRRLLQDYQPNADAPRK